MSYSLSYHVEAARKNRESDEPLLRSAEFSVILVFMDPDQIRQDIELKVVELIKSQLASGAMTEERSQQISKIVLDALQPGMNFQDLYKAIFSLDDNCTELSGVVLPYARDYENNVTQKAAEMVKNYIRVGKYDAAVKLSKDTIEGKVKLQWSGKSN